MGMTLYGNRYGYSHETLGLAPLCVIAIDQKFAKIADEGFSNNQESKVSVLQDMQNDGYDLNQLPPAALAKVDRQLEQVGLNRKQVIQELEQQIARFRDNFRPSTMRPGRM